MKLCCGLLLLFLFITSLQAQYTPGLNNNVKLLSQKHDYQRYSNIWGYVDSLGNEYAIIGHNAGTSFYNITNPSNPVEVGMIPGPTTQGTIWREIKTYKNYAYVVSEHTSPNSLSGVQIMDLSYLPDSIRYVGRYLWPGVNSNSARAHTVNVDSTGYLYIHGGTATAGGAVNGGIRIFSLANPENPLPVSTFDPRYVHDAFIRDTILFASNIYEGGHLDILNISDPSNPQLIHSHIYLNGFSHNSWITEDKNYLVQTDEQNGLTVKVFDIRVLWDDNPNNNHEIFLVGEYLSTSSSLAHEPRVRGKYLYVSHYNQGVRVVDISEPANLAEIGYYATPNDWGVWPFFPSGNFIVSDIQNGLYVFQLDSVSAGGIQGVVTDYHTGQSLSNVNLRFIEANKTTLTNQSGNFSFRTNEGNHKVILTRSGYLPDTVVVNLPAGNNIVQDFTLKNNLARISVSVDSISVNMPVDTILTYNFLITNTGTGTLHYELDDAFNSLRLNNDLPWLLLNPNSGDIAAGNSEQITAEFNSNGLVKDSVYLGNIIITSNDPTHLIKLIPVSLSTSTTLNADDINNIVFTFELEQNYPNPFNPVTVIPFSIPEISNVKIKVYNIIGQEIITLLNKELAAGSYKISWNGRDKGGSLVTSGIYFYKLETPGKNIVKKMVLSK